MNITAFLDNTYCYIGHQHPAWKHNPLAKVLRVLVRQTANIVLPIHYRATAGRASNRLNANGASKASPRLIVSLTSFPGRIPRLWLVIESLLRQTHKPDMIILWLSLDQFPGRLADLPHSLTRLQKRGLTIVFREGDIRSHKKYYYTQKEYPNDIMVTVDDDIFYHPRMLELLWNAHKEYPKCVICNHAHQMVFSPEGKVTPYSLWNYNSHAKDNLFVIGAGGNLYPPHSLASAVVDIDAARSTCPIGDDIWLNAMAKLAGTQIVHSSMHGFTGLPVINHDATTLWSHNIGPDSGNDTQIKSLESYCLETYQRSPFTAQ